MGKCFSKPQPVSEQPTQTTTATTAASTVPVAQPAQPTTTATAPVATNEPVLAAAIPSSATTMSKPVAIIIYSMYGHIAKLAEAVKSGVEASGASATIYQVAETLPQEVLTKMHAPPKGDYPVASPETLKEHDAFLFGIPTRYGNMPAQFKAFWDATGQLWAAGALDGKVAGIFQCTASMGGGQETTALNTMSTLVHHGMIFIPLGYKHVFAQLSNLEEVHGGSAWGAGTLAGGDGSRQPSALELEVATIQGKTFATKAKKFIS